MKVAIIEDEIHTALLLQQLIEKHLNVPVIKTLGSVVDTVHYLSMHQEEIDLLFMDIQLADGKCFEVFKHLDIHIPTIFCTAYDKFTLDAFKNNGIDYILKPFKDQDIVEALDKYKKLISRIQKKPILQNPVHTLTHETYQKIFLVPYRNQTKTIRIEEIALFHLQEEKVYIVSVENDRFQMFKKMHYIESVIDPSLFFRINRQLLINRTSIIGYTKLENRKISLQLNIAFDQIATVSRLKVTRFKEWLET